MENKREPFFTDDDAESRSQFDRGLMISIASANARCEPLLKAYECLKQALYVIEFSRGTDAGSVNAHNYSVARTALAAAERILKDG